MDSIIPLEMVSKILANLGKIDILNCRLVCNSWNEECLKHLRKSKFTKLLSLKNIEKYVEFIQINPRFVLPFHIDLDITIFISEQTESNKFVEFIKYLKLLISLFGPECVVGLSLYMYLCDCSNYDDGYLDEEILTMFTELFISISTGLKMIDLKYLMVHTSRTPAPFFESATGILRQRHTKFPILKNFKLNKNTTSSYPLIQFIFDSSPKLEKILSHNLNSFISISIPFEKLKTLKLKCIDRPSYLLEKIQERNSLPVIEKLSVAISYDTKAQTEIYHNILNLFSRTIQDLTIKLDGNCGFTIPFPVFPKLQKFKLKLFKHRTHKPFYINPQVLNFNSNTFPGLKSIKIPNVCCFMPHCLLEKYPIFSKIKNITLSVYDWFSTSWLINDDINSMCQFLQKNINHLHLVFPNVTTVVIVDKCIDSKRHVIQLIKELIKSPQSSNIQNITFQNIEQDYLERVFKELNHQSRFLEKLQSNPKIEQINKNVSKNCTNPSGMISHDEINKLEEENKSIEHNMTNVRAIILEQNDGKIIVEMNLSGLDLMVKYFPNLCQIAISSLKFDQDKQKCWKQIQDIRIQFPNLTINII